MREGVKTRNHGVAPIVFHPMNMNYEFTSRINNHCGGLLSLSVIFLKGRRKIFEINFESYVQPRRHFSLFNVNEQCRRITDAKFSDSWAAYQKYLHNKLYLMKQKVIPVGVYLIKAFHKFADTEAFKIDFSC